MERIVSRDGTEIAYWTSGDGPPLILVHGTTADHTRWAPLLPYLEPHATVYAIDRRGRGASGDAPAYSLERELEDVAAVIDTIAGDTRSPVDVYGHSYGAVCALGAASMTSAVRRLVLYEPPGRAAVESSPSEVHQRIETLVARDDREGALITFMREIVALPEDQMQMVQSQPSWAARIAAAHTIVREELAPAEFDPARAAGVAVPTLMIVGGDSEVSMRQDTVAIADVLPDVRIVELPGQQHVGDVLAPEAFARHVVDFLYGSG